MSSAVAPPISEPTRLSTVPTSQIAQAEPTPQNAARFAVVTSQMLEQLTRGVTGATLAPLLASAMASLRPQTIRLQAHADAVLVNHQSIPPKLITSWRAHLQQHSIQRIDFHNDASEAELLHFLALLAGPTSSVSFAARWLERGAWRIHMEVDGVPADACGASKHQALRLLDELVSPTGSLQRDVTDEELDVLSSAVAHGVCAKDGDPLFAVLRLAGERAVKSLLIALANTTSGSQRRRLFETVALLNVGHQYLIALLAHPIWYVARNAASLLGELRVTAADTALASLSEHPDHRVRIAAVTALGRLHSDVATESLHVAVTDRSAEVRAAAWIMWQQRDHAPCDTIVNHALREESDQTVQRAVLDCVARFDTLDVTNALVRFCAHSTAHAAPLELLALGVELLAQRRPQSARQFIRHMADVQS